MKSLISFTNKANLGLSRKLSINIATADRLVHSIQCHVGAFKLAIAKLTNFCKKKKAFLE